MNHVRVAPGIRRFAVEEARGRLAQVLTRRSRSRASRRQPRQHRGLQSPCRSTAASYFAPRSLPIVPSNAPTPVPRIDGNRVVESVDELQDRRCSADRPASRSARRDSVRAALPRRNRVDDVTERPEPDKQELRRRRSVTASRRDAREQVARGVILRIADDGDAAAVGAHDIALGNGVERCSRCPCSGRPGAAARAADRQWAPGTRST